MSDDDNILVRDRTAFLFGALIVVVAVVLCVVVGALIGWAMAGFA